MSQTQKPIHHRILILVSFVSFFGSMTYGVVNMINSGLHQPPENIAQAASSAPAASELQASRLQMQERDYEMVLKQEPQNQVALKGLITARLQMNNPKGAVKPLEELVKLNPGKQEYKTLLAQVNKKVGESDR